MKEKQIQPDYIDNTRKLNNDQIQSTKWKQLQAKYKEYIKLLKRKLQHAEKKLIGAEKSSTEEHSHQSQDKVIHRFCGILNQLRLKNLNWGFSSIRYQLSEQQKEKKLEDCLKICNKFSQKLYKQFFFEKFKQMKHKKVQKNIKMRLLITILSNILKKGINISEPFTCIKNYHKSKIKSHQLDNYLKNVNHKFKNIIRKAFYQIKIFGVQYPKIQQNSIQQINYLKNLLSFQNIISFQSPNKHINLSAYIEIYKQNCKLKQVIRQLRETNANINDALQNSIDQRQRQIKKKSEGLKSLAEEMRQKDDLIQQYQRELDVYKSLKDHSITTLAQIQIEKRKLQLSNSKLNQEFTIKQDIYRQERQKYTMQIKRLESVEIQQKQIISKLENELQNLRNFKLESDYQKEITQVQKQTILQLQSRLNQKQKKLVKVNHQTNKMMRKLTNMSKIIKQHPGNLMEISIVQEQIQNQPQLVQQNSAFDIIDIVQRILIKDETLKLEQQIKQPQKFTRLKNIQQKVFQLSSINQSRQKQNRTKRKRYNNQQSEVLEIPKSRMINGSSVYQAFSGRSQISQSRHNQQRVPNFTIRLIELQTQNNKKQAVIFALKQKFMHIRDVIFKLLKSLQLKQNLPKETDNILAILFDMFQYSQTQKTQIFKKKNDENAKKKAGFFNFFN